MTIYKFLPGVITISILCTPAVAEYKAGDTVVVIKDGTAIIENERVARKVNRGLVLKIEAVNGDWLSVLHVPPGSVFQGDVLAPDEAIAAFARQIKENPKDAGAFIGRALLNVNKNDFDAAITDLGRAVRIDPSNAGAFMERGKCWLEKAEFDKAMNDFGAAIHINPQDPTPHCLRASAWLTKSKYDNAITEATKALRLAPGCYQASMSRGEAWLQKGKYDRAISDYERAALAGAPAAAAWRTSAWIYATCPDEKYRNGGKAIGHARLACELTGWENAIYLDTFAAAYAEFGDFKSAIEQETKAIDLASEKQKDEFQTRLDLYKFGKPFRDDPKK